MAEISPVNNSNSQSSIASEIAARNQAPPEAQSQAQTPSNVNQQPTEVLASLGIGQNLNVQA